MCLCQPPSSVGRPRWRQPGMNGVEPQSHLRARSSRVPFIFISAFPEEAIRRRALREGGYLLSSQALRWLCSNHPSQHRDLRKEASSRNLKKWAGGCCHRPNSPASVRSVEERSRSSSRRGPGTDRASASDAGGIETRRLSRFRSHLLYIVVAARALERTCPLSSKLAPNLAAHSLIVQPGAHDASG